MAPRLVRSVRNWRTFARYWALFGVHGVGVCAPASSFSAIVGVWQPVTLDGVVESDFARASITDGSAGLLVVPTRLLKLRSKRTVAAPASRSCWGTSVPEATAIVRPGSAGIGASWPPKSTQTRRLEGTPHESRHAGEAAGPPKAKEPPPRRSRRSGWRRETASSLKPGYPPPAGARPPRRARRRVTTVKRSDPFQRAKWLNHAVVLCGLWTILLMKARRGGWRTGRFPAREAGLRARRFSPLHLSGAWRQAGRRLRHVASRHVRGRAAADELERELDLGPEQLEHTTRRPARRRPRAPRARRGRREQPPRRGRAPSRRRFPRLIPPSMSTSMRPSTASTTSGSASIVAERRPS